MHCLIISESAGFPWGMAATSRVRNIGKALIDQGVSVHYIGLRGANTAFGKNKRKNGVVENISYSYPSCFPVRSKNWFVRRVDDFLGK